MTRLSGLVPFNAVCMPLFDTPLRSRLRMTTETYLTHMRSVLPFRMLLSRKDLILLAMKSTLQDNPLCPPLSEMCPVYIDKVEAWPSAVNLAQRSEASYNSQTCCLRMLKT